jgi:hypothetical protein
MGIQVTPIPRLTVLTVPAFTLGSANAAGSAATAVASNSTLLAFDATDPAAVAASAVVGTATVVSRRDHVHSGVTQDTLIEAASAVKAHCNITAAGALSANSLGVSSITDTGTGNHRINFSTSFSAAQMSGGTIIDSPNDKHQAHSVQLDVVSSAIVITYLANPDTMVLSDMNTAHVFCGVQ